MIKWIKRLFESPKKKEERTEIPWGDFGEAEAEATACQYDPTTGKRSCE